MRAISELAAFVSSYPVSALPAATRREILWLILALVVAAAAGLQSPLAEAARKAALDAYGEEPISIWLADKHSSAAGAAVANSAAASALDIDDIHRGAGGDTGAGVIPAALGVAQAVDASVSEMMVAIALVYEIALRVAHSRPGRTIDTYATGRWIGYVAAAAACRLLGLGPAETAHALAIAGSEAPSATSEFVGSTIKKAIHPAVVAGMTAAYRARAIELTPSREFVSAFPAETPARVVMDQAKRPEAMIVLHPFGGCPKPVIHRPGRAEVQNASRENVHRGRQDEILAAIGNLETAGFRPLLAAPLGTGHTTQTTILPEYVWTSCGFEFSK
ncbi:2-methylcitrate dehydratase PrpD [Rhizobium mesoamericanum]|uniref:MmgE/PrpD family protein n=1 Tax=Rhizobium mesoamericanum TaxID=1079800 RepID=UPI0027882410|nr:MmgE/PrpD family protein [Rhizobium mesoamericanum]MDQ0564352.1 2-methylcitrate dehydratase PrpD [Rhizobium mesoamericanum]